MTKKLHIAMLSIHSSPLGELGARDTGGMSVYILALCDRLGEKGHRLDIFTARKLPDNKDMIWLAEGVRLIYVGGDEQTPTLKAGDAELETTMLAARIDRFRQEGSISYSLIHSNYWRSGLVGEQLGVTWNCPHLMTFHTLAQAKTDSSVGHVEDQQRLVAEKRLIENCTTVLVPTRSEYKRYTDLADEESPRFAVLGCGVDLERFHPLTETTSYRPEKTTNDKADLLFVGRFDVMKGLPDLLQSLALVKRKNGDIRLGLIGGDGGESPVFEDLHRQAKELDLLENIVFHGRVAHEQLVHHYHNATAVVMPSHYESFGLVILEALACGIPVAATRVGIASEVIRSGINGYLAEPGDPESLAKAIVATLTLATETSSVKVRQTAMDFDWWNVADRLEDVYYNNLNTFKISINDKPYTEKI